MTILLSFFVALLPLIMPGMLFARAKTPLSYLAHLFLWSVSISVLLSYTFATLGIPVLWIWPLAAACAVYARIRRYPVPNHVIPTISIFLLICTLFLIPLAYNHNGMPTGDSQKAILWAQQILDTDKLPVYAQSMDMYNRDPVDFYTPGLHSLTASVMAITPYPLQTTAILSIVLAVAVAWIGAAIARNLFKQTSLFLPITTGFLILTHIRFLRYLREPGYHMQNILGELLLFGLLYIGIDLLRMWSWYKAVLFTLTGLALVFSHQFSAFIAFFTLIPLATLHLIHHKDAITIHMRRSFITPTIYILILTIMIGGAIAIDLHHKIPHIFTTSPNLISEIPPFLAYPQTMNTIWFIAGISGLALLALTQTSAPVRAFTLCAALLLTLSQGPRLGIDIPPVRTLFYSVVPLSIAGAYFITRLATRTGEYTLTTRIVAFLLIILPGITSTHAAFSSVSHDVRSNSTLTSSQYELVRTLTSLEGGVLTDDYNRRSTSWLILAGNPTYARLSGEMRRQAQEASQSDIRSKLYMRQLDFEKIFMLGSRPEVLALAHKHNIEWITGVERNSLLTFEHNPRLTPYAQAGDTTLFHVHSNTSMENISDTFRWLLRNTTLANDIGTREDTFGRLPASIRSPRMSNPLVDNRGTHRTVAAGRIPLEFNIATYVQSLWDKEKTGYPDTTVQFLMEFENDDSPLTVLSPTGAEFIVHDGVLIDIPARALPFDDEGHTVLTVLNPDNRDIKIYLIALGLSRIP